MKIGIMSDSHDNLPRVKQALARFAELGVERILHAGDICSPFVFLLFRHYEMPLTAVFGNNDGEWLFLADLVRDIGEIRKGPVELSLGERNIALMHEPVFLDALADSGHFDLVIYGHTHDLDERKRGKCIIANPGESCGYLRDRSTAMVCDLETMKITTFDID